MVTGQAGITALKVRTHATCARVVANRAASAPLPEPETVTQPAQPIKDVYQNHRAGMCGFCLQFARIRMRIVGTGRHPVIVVMDTTAGS